MLLIILTCLIYFLLLMITTHHLELKWLLFSMIALITYLINKQILTILVGCIFILIVLFVVIIYFLGNNKVLDEDIHYIILFGYRLRNNEIMPLLKYRLDTTVSYMYKHNKAKVILSGGTTRENTVAESEVMKEYLIQQGINEDKILIESNSKTTIENMMYTKELVHDLHEPILLITNHFHIYRCRQLAKKIGFKNIYSLHSKDGIEGINMAVEEILWLLLMIIG